MNTQRTNVQKLTLSLLLGAATAQGTTGGGRDAICGEGEVRYQGGCTVYNPRWRELIDEMREGQRHFDRLTDMAQQRMMDLRNGGRRGEDRRGPDGPGGPQGMKPGKALR